MAFPDFFGRMLREGLWFAAIVIISFGILYSIVISKVFPATTFGLPALEAVRKDFGPISAFI